MDGFEALTAIKNDPRTATIPVMMYTSQEGELYFSQARALGAMGVLPKQTKPADVSRGALRTAAPAGRAPARRAKSPPCGSLRCPNRGLPVPDGEPPSGQISAHRPAELPDPRDARPARSDAARSRHRAATFCRPVA